MKRQILLSLMATLFAGCSYIYGSLSPGTEMMLDQNGANAVLVDGMEHYQTSGSLDWQVSKGTKIRVIKDHPDINKTEIYILEGDARNHTFTIYRSQLLPMGATR